MFSLVYIIDAVATRKFLFVLEMVLCILLIETL
jgi:hypothetical protein